MSYEQKIELLLSDHRGIYIPRDFASECSHWDNFTDEDKAILSDPSNEAYWDAWDHVLSNATYKHKNGHIYTLYQDGDLWAVRDDMTDEDWEEWRGPC